MRFIKSILSSVALVLVGGATAMAQDPTIKVDVTSTESHTVWYMQPVWLAIGGIVLLLVIVLAVMAARNKGSSTTVVR